MCAGPGTSSAVPQVAPACPNGGALEPELWWEWTENSLDAALLDAWTSPIAIPLYDTSEDGHVDREDLASVVVGAHSSGTTSALVVLDPLTGEPQSLVQTPSFDGTYLFGGAPGAARLSADGPVLLPIPYYDRDDPRTVYGCPLVLGAFDVGGQLAWTALMGWPQPDQCQPENTIRPGQSPIRFARMEDGPGPLIISDYIAFTADGRWAGYPAVMSPDSYDPLGQSLDVVDLDLDGQAELLRANAWYDSALEPVWYDPDFREERDVLGFIPAPGEDVRVVASVSLGAIDLTMRDSRANLLWFLGTSGGTAAPGSVADFDGDGVSEVAVFQRDVALTIRRADGTSLWQRDAPALGGNVTAAPAFDFDGDGAYDLAMLGPEGIRILDGRTGDDLWLDPLHPYEDYYEHPIVVDLDRDGSAELVVPGRHMSDETNRFIPTSVWRSPTRDWYTDTTEWPWDGARPGALDDDLMVRPSAEVFAEAGGLFRAARRLYGGRDIFPEVATWCDPNCDDTILRVGVDVVNQGNVRMPAGVRILVYDDGALIASAEVPASVRAGTRYGPTWIELPREASGHTLTIELQAPVDADGLYECDAENNRTEVEAASCE